MMCLHVMSAAKRLVLSGSVAHVDLLAAVDFQTSMGFTIVAIFAFL
jgi:hypothetical protein